jgi:hypothetical protein
MSKEIPMPRNFLRAALHRLVPAFAALVLIAGSASAQDMTSADVTRLQQSVDQIGSDLAKLQTTDRTAARAMQSELTDLEEEVTYLKVKLRKERVVSRSDYMDVRDRLDDLRSRVNGTNSSGRYGSGTRSSDPAVEARESSVDTAAPGTIPSGTEIDVRLETALSSNTNQVEDRFEGRTIVDLRQNGRVLIPAGSRVRGVVTAVREAGRVDRKGSLSLSFDELTINGRTQPIRGSVTQALESGGYKEDAGKIGAGAAVGAILGGILGGVKGAVAGILIGGGGVVATTEGKDVELAPGMVLRMRFDEPLSLRGTF